MTIASRYDLPLHMLFTILLGMTVAAAGLCSREAAELQGLSPVVINACDIVDVGVITSASETTSLAATVAAKIKNASVQWKFVSKTADGHFLRFRWPRPAAVDYIGLWLKNPAGQPGQLAVAFEMQDGQRIPLKSQIIGEERNWYQLAYRVPAEIAWDSVAAVAVELNGLAVGAACEFYIDEVMGYSYPPLPINASVEAPANAAAGATINVKATVRALASRAQWPHMRLALVQDSYEVASAFVPGQTEPVAQGDEREIAGRIAIPAYVPAGSYTVGVTGDVSVELSGSYAVQVANDAAQPTATVDAAHNTLKIDGVKISPIFCEVGTGVLPDVPWSPSVFVLDATSDHDPYGRSGDVWLDRETFDYADIDARLASVLRARPDALILVRVYTSAPEWWMDANPGELMEFEETKQSFTRLSPAQRRWPAWASAKWQQAAVTALSAFVTHIETSPAKNAVIAYQLCSGEEGNWVYPGTAQDVMGGYSAAQTHAFQQWLQEKYGSLASLRGAWGQPLRPYQTTEALNEGRPILGWTQVEVPSPQFRRQGHRDIGILREPTVAQEAIDYDVFSSDVVVDVIELLAAAVKTAAPNKLCGASYGHVFSLAQRTTNVQGSGHISLSRAIGSELLDFLVAPSNEIGAEKKRRICFNSVAASIREHGKLAITEVRRHASTANALSDDAHVSTALASGAAVVLPAQLSGVAGWHELEKRSQLALSADAWRPGEVAIVVDDVSLAYVFPGNELLTSLLGEQMRGIVNIGAASDVWLLEDVLDGACPKYPFYIFLNAFSLNGEERSALRSRLVRENAGALYFYAAGCIDNHVGGRTAKELMGISIIPLQGNGPLRVEVPYPQVSYGDGAKVSPRFFCRVYDEDEMGTLKGTERAGLVARRSASGNVYWSVAPNVPAQLLRTFAQESGAHLLGDAGLAITAAGSFVSAYAQEAGKYGADIGETASVYDARTGEAMASVGNRVTLEMEEGETALLYLEDQFSDKR